MENKLISIIIPVYKVEEYLDECVQSVIDQTYKNLEIILVDDGSPDNCGFLCDAWAKKDSRIKVIHKENGGLSSARNAGVLAASGEYIGFIDSDDYIAPDMYEKLYSLITENDADMALCGVKRKNENGETFSPFSTRQIGEFQGEEIFNTVDFNNPYYIITVNRLYKKTVAKKVIFPKGKIHEDEFTAHRFYGECEKIVCSNDLLYVYIRRESSIMNGKISSKRLDCIDALLDRYKYFSESGRKDLSRESCIRAYIFMLNLMGRLDFNASKSAIKQKIKNLTLPLIKCSFLRVVKLYLRYASAKLKSKKGEKI